MRIMPRLLACGILACASTASAQVATSPLARFAGNWDLRGTQSAGSREDTYHIFEYCRWSNQQAFMVCEERTVGKAISDVTLMWHDESAHLFRFAGISIDGSAGSGTIDIAPHRWVWNGNSRGAQRDRTVNQWVTPDKVVYTVEASSDGGKTWKSTGHGTEERLQAAPAS